MENVFDCFNNARAEVYSLKKTAANGYISRDEAITERKKLAELDVDLQPYSGGLAEKEYGLTVNCQKRLFCAPCEHIKEGNYMKAGAENYRILYVQSWELGTEALLERVKL